jgi:uncharacterized membrane protein YfbV (UPF0208 family)
LSEFELERELVENKQHPDYLEKQEEYQKLKEQRMKRAIQRLEETKRNVQEMFEAQLKAARDTMNV